MPHIQETSPDRRRFLALAGAAAGTVLFGRAGPAWAGLHAPRRLSFYSVHTDEALDTVYWEGGRYLPDALAAVDHHLRDFRTGDVRPIDCRLLDLLHALNGVLENRAPLHVISGYRCPATNAMLARRSRQVARNSYHVYGRAIDVRLPTRDLATLREAALDLAGGGVGYYPGDNFVHLDTGPVRCW